MSSTSFYSCRLLWAQHIKWKTARSYRTSVVIATLTRIFPFFHQMKRSQYKLPACLQYYKLLFLLLFHNPGGTWAGHSWALHIPEGTGKAPLGTGLHLDMQVTPLLRHQSSADTAAPSKMHWNLEVCSKTRWPRSTQRSHLVGRRGNIDFTHNNIKVAVWMTRF